MDRKRYMLGLAAVLGLAVLTGRPSPAEEPKADDATRQEAQAADVELLADAYRLAEFAEQHKSPEAYITAGGLVRKLQALTKGDLGKLETTPEVQDEDGNPVKDAKVDAEEPESLEDTAQGFFDSASKLGAELGVSKEVEALIRAAKKRDYERGARGALGGPKVIVRQLAPGRSHVYRIPFDTHSVGAIGFQSSAPARCRMQAGGNVHFNQVVRVGNYTWHPRGAGAKVFTIRVTNPRRFPVTYRLFTN